MKFGDKMMEIKPIIWIASTKNDLISLPDGVQDEIGHALYQAQKGEKNDKAKPFKGFGSAAVLEIIENNIGVTWGVTKFSRYVDNHTMSSP